MEPTNNKDLIEKEIAYLKLALKIAKIRHQGDEPPKNLLHQAYEAGRLACVSKEELKNLMG